ncbi:MAG: hypothetical protein R3C14_28350 [Caldilineaceae bacterium]
METMIEVQPHGVVVLPPELCEQYQIHTGDHLRLVDRDGVFILAQQKEPAAFQREQRIQAFEAEIAHFERLKPQLLQQYPGRYVALRLQKEEITLCQPHFLAWIRIWNGLACGKRSIPV